MASPGRGLGRRGVSVAAEEQRLRQIGEQLRQLPPGVPNESQQRLFLEARGEVRSWPSAIRCWTSTRSCSSSRPRAVSRTCPTSSTAGGRGRAAGCFVLEGFKSEQPKAPLPDGRHARGQFHAARPVLRRQEGAVRLLQILCRRWRTERDKANKATCPRMRSITFTR